MAVACPECESSDLDLVEITTDERRRVRCESCGYVWVRGEPKRGASATERISARSESLIVFDRDDDAYLAWVHTWPHGYVLNCERSLNPNYLVLHRAVCYTITDPGPQATTWTEHEYIKVCSTDRQQLRQWASDRTQSVPTYCQLCM